MTVQWPLVKAGLVSLWRAAATSDDAVYSGVPTTADLPMRWVTVGWMETQQGSSGGTFTRTRTEDPLLSDEQGEIHCLLVAQSGDPDQDAVEAAAFEFYEVLESAAQKDNTLGGLLAQNGYVEITGEPIPAGSGSAARCEISIVVKYFTTSY